MAESEAMPPMPMDGKHHHVEGEEEEHHSEDGFVDDDSSSLPPDYFDPNKKGDDDDHKKSSEQSEQGTAPTAAMTSSLAASTTSFSFEITLPPPADISPLSCRESVVTAMMARPLDRALEQQRIPRHPPYDEYSGGAPSPSERRRSSHHRRSHHHRKSVDDDGHGEDRRSERSRSIHAKIRRDLGNTSALSETSSEDKKAADEQQRRRRSRSEKPKGSSGRSKSTDGKRLSSSRSKSRDISSDKQKKRHRSKSRSAREGDRTSSGRRRQESSRKLFTIAAIKEEVEEAIVVESPRKTKDPTEKDSQPRQRSRSRQRSPSSRNNRRPSSSHRHKNGNSRSKSRKRSPSKSGKRSSSQKPTDGSSRDRSKSKTRHRSRSRSNSRTREKTTEQEAKEYLAMLSGLQPAASEDSTQDKASTPSFLSRLAESHSTTKSNDGSKRQNSATIDKDTIMKPKSVRWGAFDDAFASDNTTQKAPMAAVQEENEEDSRLKASPEKFPRQYEKSRGHRSRSKSQSGRQRSKSRRRREAEEEKEKKPESHRKMKWDKLLNASKTNFQFSNDSFCFDQKDEPKTPSPLKTIQPKITPVVLRGGLGSPTSFPKIAMGGEEVTTSQSITRPTAFPSPTPSVSSISDSQVRLQTANALILEKRRRKEASKARQEELNSMKSPPSAMDMSDTFEFCFPKSPFDIVQRGSQFSPALRVSNTAISPQRRVEHANFPLGEWDTKCKVALSTPPSRRDELKKKMSELAAKPKRQLLPDESKPEEANEPLTCSEETQAETARISRKERAEARRAKRRQKMGESSSKWKNLTIKAEEIQKPESFRESLGKLEEICEKQQEGGLQRKASIASSKWAGIKGSINFISKMKMKATELESND